MSIFIDGSHRSPLVLIRYAVVLSSTSSGVTDFSAPPPLHLLFNRVPFWRGGGGIGTAPTPQTEGGPGAPPRKIVNIQDAKTAFLGVLVCLDNKLEDRHVYDYLIVF